LKTSLEPNLWNWRTTMFPGYYWKMMVLVAMVPGFSVFL
jgi:hypothetical protein